MKKRNVISNKNLPIRPPIIGTVVWCLVLDKIDAPGWVFGAFVTLILIFWIVFFVDVFNRNVVDVINNDGA